MNMSQAIKLEPCTLLDELVIERDVLRRDLHKQTGDRAAITRINIREINGRIDACLCSMCRDREMLVSNLRKQSGEELAKTLAAIRDLTQKIEALESVR